MATDMIRYNTRMFNKHTNYTNGTTMKHITRHPQILILTEPQQYWLMYK